MPLIATKTLGRWMTWSMVALLIASVAFWFVGRETLPRTIVVATGEKGGLYYALGTEIQASLRRRLGRMPEVLATAGSVENAQLLQRGEADLAIVQGGSIALDELSVVTPLYPELVLVIVRLDRNIDTLPDLLGRNVALGRKGSGMRESALGLLARYRIGPDEFGMNDLYFRQLLDTPELDAAIVTTGIENHDVNEVLETNEFKYLRCWTRTPWKCVIHTFAAWRFHPGCSQNCPPSLHFPRRRWRQPRIWSHVRMPIRLWSTPHSPPFTRRTCDCKFRR